MSESKAAVRSPFRSLLTGVVMTVLVLAAGAAALGGARPADPDWLAARLAAVRAEIWWQERAISVELGDTAAAARGTAQVVERVLAELELIARESAALESVERARLGRERRALEGEARALATLGTGLGESGGARPRFAWHAAARDSGCRGAASAAGLAVEGTLRPETWVRWAVPAYGPARLRIETDRLAELRLELFAACPGPEEAPVAAASGTGRVDLLLDAGKAPEREVVARLLAAPEAKGLFRAELSTGTGGISGRVLRAADAAPVAGTSVEAWSPEGRLAAAVVTEGDGTFLLAGLAPGDYRLVALPQRGELVAAILGGGACPGGPPRGCRTAEGRPVTVTAGATAEGVEFRLDTGGTIAGRVRAQATGEPVQPAWVGLYDATGGWVDSEYTDSLGRYSFSGLTGSFRVLAEAGGFLAELFEETPCPYCDVSAGTPVDVAEGVHRVDVDFTLDAGGSIEGAVVSSLGGPPANGVSAYCRLAIPGSSWQWVSVDASGHFSTSGLYPGRYLLQVFASGHAPRMHGGPSCTYGSCGGWFCDEGTGAQIEVPLEGVVVVPETILEAFGGLEGVITEVDEATPIGGVEVFVQEMSSMCGGGIATTGPDGLYRVESLPPAAHQASTANALGYRNEVFDDLPCAPAGCPDPPAGAPIEVPLLAGTSGIDFALEAGGTISGVVLDTAGAVVPLGPPFGSIQLFGTGGNLVAMMRTIPGTGAYAFRGLPAGTFFVLARTVGMQGWESQLFQGHPCPSTGCDPTAGTPIVLADGEERTDVDFVLDRWARLKGQVRDAATGVPLSDVNIDSRDLGGTQVGWAMTNASGEFDLGARPSATVYLTAQKSGREHELYPEIPCPGAIGTDCLLSAGTSFPAALNTVQTGIDFTLRPAPAIAGHVLDETGRPAPGVTIDVFDSTGYRSRSVISDATGRYEASIWGGESFRLGTDNGFGALDMLYQNVPCPEGPAWLGLCDLALATPVPVREWEVVEGIDFTLARWPIFRHGFENGSFVGWDGSAGE